MKKLLTNIMFFLIWGANSIYSLKDLRLSTPVPLPTMIIILVSWFLLLSYLLLF
jgi:hypothetical protein